MNVPRQLIGAKANRDRQIADELGADSFRSLGRRALYETLGRSRRGEGLCDACLTGVYPVKAPGVRRRQPR